MRNYEMTTIDEVNFEMTELLRCFETLNENTVGALEPVASIATTLSQIANDINTLKMQMNGIESRYTQREEKHAQLAAVVEDELLLPVTPRDLELEKGYTDNSGIKLKATVVAQGRFTSLVTGMQVAEKLGQADNNTPVEITDYDDVPRSMSWIELQILMLRYMVYCKYVESL